MAPSQSVEQILTADAQKASRRNFRFRKKFGKLLPAGETLVDDFSCAIHKQILLHGRLFLSQHYLCFHSNVLGYQTLEIIQLHKITALEKRLVNLINPAVMVYVEETKSKYEFASFVSRDNAFNILQYVLWNLDRSVSMDRLRLLQVYESEGPEGQELDDEEDEGDSCTEDTESDVSWEGSSVGRSVADDDTDALGDHDGSCDDHPRTGGEERLADQTPPLPTDNSVHFLADQHPYAEVVDQAYPFEDVDSFCCLFFSAESSFLLDYHVRRLDSGVQISPWKPHAQFGVIRSVSFRSPVNAPFGPKTAQVNETQRMFRNPQGDVVVETASATLGVPYGDYFRVESRWIAAGSQDPTNSVRFTVAVGVHFVKTPYSWIKGKIEDAAIKESRDAYTMMARFMRDYMRDAVSHGAVAGTFPPLGLALPPPSCQMHSLTPSTPGGKRVLAPSPALQPSPAVAGTSTGTLQRPSATNSSHGHDEVRNPTGEQDLLAGAGVGAPSSLSQSFRRRLSRNADPDSTNGPASTAGVLSSKAGSCKIGGESECITQDSAPPGRQTSSISTPAGAVTGVRLSPQGSLRYGTVAAASACSGSVVVRRRRRRRPRGEVALFLVVIALFGFLLWGLVMLQSRLAVIERTMERLGVDPAATMGRASCSVPVTSQIPTCSSTRSPRAATSLGQSHPASVQSSPSPSLSNSCMTWSGGTGEGSTCPHNSQLPPADKGHTECGSKDRPLVLSGVCSDVASNPLSTTIPQTAAALCP